MPDLSPAAVHSFWHDYNDATIYKVIAFMECVENWTHDGHEDVEQALTALGQALDTIGSYELGGEALFIEVGNHVKTSRNLRLLQAIDSANPGSASKLLIHAEEVSQEDNDPAGLFLRRNVVFERLRLLSRVFSPARFELILRSLEGDDEA